MHSANWSGPCPDWAGFCAADGKFDSIKAARIFLLVAFFILWPIVLIQAEFHGWLPLAMIELDQICGFYQLNK